MRHSMRNRWWVSLSVLSVLMLVSHAGRSQDEFTAVPETSVERQEPQSLQDEYLQLVKAKAELMDEETLAKEIEQLKAGISELQATKKLNAAADQLRVLIDEFPDSQAASAARRMLQTRENSETRFRTRDTLRLEPEPMPDHGFDSVPLNSSRRTHLPSVQDDF